MLNEKAFHNVAGKAQEGGLLLVALQIAAALERLDFDQHHVQLVNQKGWLPGVLAPFTLHFGGRQPAQFGVEQLDQPVGGRPVTIAKIRRAIVSGEGGSVIADANQFIS